jgi:hypothetical protein
MNPWMKLLFLIELSVKIVARKGNTKLLHALFKLYVPFELIFSGKIMRIIQCLTCGARNEHSTRSCPISKVCFTCGMKGHINAVSSLLYLAEYSNDFSTELPE